MKLRNIAVIAHVDHGKTTLTDRLLYQSGMFRAEDLDKLAGGQHGLIMDSGDLERERGITITAKNCSIRWTDPRNKDEYKINLIDTPGHADFGGEVERVLNMADGCLLVVDSFEGPMPQTRFVLSKALALGLKPIVVVNKIDKPSARPDAVVDEIFDLLVALDAPESALDFPVVYASGRDGWATVDRAKTEEGKRPKDLLELFYAIVDHIPEPYAEGSSRGAAAGFKSREEALANPLQIMVTAILYSDYVGRIAVGRVTAGRIKPSMPVMLINRAGEQFKQRTLEVEVFEALGRVKAEEVTAGDICAVIGLDHVEIGATITDIETPKPMPPVKVDEPTVTMAFRVNDSPFAGRDGKFVTGRQVGERLTKELEKNVALRVEREAGADAFQVSGRGLMHLGVLIETMRREGYELSVGKPQVIMKQIDGKECEPVETLAVDCPVASQSDVMALVLSRRGELRSMDAKAGTSGWIHMEFKIPSRSLFGLRTMMLTTTRGDAVMYHNLLGYEPVKGDAPRRAAGVMIGGEGGQVTSYSLDRLYDRGDFFVKPTDEIYMGQVVGEHCKDNDLEINLVINKKLSNVRASGSDDMAKIKPMRQMSLENCLEYIESDELVEVTPNFIRMRKRYLTENERKRFGKQ
ncbi:MAG: translational GTPase TypA [Opitutia bacterium]|nr:translational GTPase TypA [Opitutales bacterium]PHX69207.1 MAG: translational GTPase TypA [Opitutae bacterium]